MNRGSYLLAELSWPKGTRTESFGFLLQVLARRVDKTMKTRLDELGLTFKFFPTLMLLLARDGQSQRDLGSALGLPEYQMSRSLDAMAEAGLIERRPNPESRRTTSVFLQEKGRQITKELPPLIKDLNDQFLDVLTEDEKDDLLRIMRKLYDTTE